MNEIKNNIKKNEINFNNFKIENMQNITTLKCNERHINCFKILDDGRLAAGDSETV